MSDPKDSAFSILKYLLITIYFFNIIVCIIFVIFGSFLVSNSPPNSTDTKEEEETKKINRFVGYLLVAGAIIGIPVSIIAIYGIFTESYRICIWTSVFAAICVFTTLFMKTNPWAIVVQIFMAGCMICYTMKLKNLENDSNDQNNPELGKVKPNENTAIVLNAYQQ